MGLTVLFICWKMLVAVLKDRRPGGKPLNHQG